MDAKLDVEAETETEILAVVSCKKNFFNYFYFYIHHTCMNVCYKSIY